MNLCVCLSVRAVSPPTMTTSSSTSTVPAASQGDDHPEECPRLDAEEEVQTSTQRCHHHPMRLQTHARQTAAEAAEDRSSLCRAPEEAQHGHGEQDRSAAEENGRPGMPPFRIKACFYSESTIKHNVIYSNEGRLI